MPKTLLARKSSVEFIHLTWAFHGPRRPADQHAVGTIIKQVILPQSSPSCPLHCESPEWFIFLLGHSFLQPLPLVWILLQLQLLKANDKLLRMTNHYMRSRTLALYTVAQALPDHKGWVISPATYSKSSLYLHSDKSFCSFPDLVLAGVLAYIPLYAPWEWTRILFIILSPTISFSLNYKAGPLGDSPLRGNLTLNQTAWFQILTVTYQLWDPGQVS